MTAAETERGWILGVGIAVLDIVNLVDAYPREDDEVRALSQRIVRGGNVANTLSVLRQFGHRCDWIGTLADDAGAALIADDLDRRGIGRGFAVTLPGTRTPTSYITLSRATGSRTIVHYRDLPELTAGDFAAVSLEGCKWVHFEGRHPAETARMIEQVRRVRPGLPISVEIEKPRPQIEQLLDSAAVLIFSRAFACTAGHGDPLGFLHEYMARCAADLCILPWGAEGAYALARGAEPVFSPAHAPPAPVDTLAAGDAFNAAVIDALLRGLGVADMLLHANRIAGHKCGREGLDGLAESAHDAGLL
jgi:ketohexokinase